jgi:hypothetical protein
MQKGSDDSPTLQGEPGSVVGWRTARLLAAGFDRELAAGLAAGGAVDLHGLLELVDRGCSPELAVRILAPLDENGQGDGEASHEDTAQSTR